MEELRPTKLSSTPQENVSALYPPWARVWAAGGYHSFSETSFRRSATKKLQGLDLSSANKQIGTCENFRRSYGMVEARMACGRVIGWGSENGLRRLGTSGENPCCDLLV